MAKLPVHLREVVAGAKGQYHVEQEVSQRKVEEENRAALPGLQVEDEDPQRQSVAKGTQDEIHQQQRRQHPDEHGGLVKALHVVC